MSSDHWQTQLDAAIDDVLDTLEAAARDGVDGQIPTPAAGVVIFSPS